MGFPKNDSMREPSCFIVAVPTLSLSVICVFDWPYTLEKGHFEALLAATIIGHPYEISRDPQKKEPRISPPSIPPYIVHHKPNEKKPVPQVIPKLHAGLKRSIFLLRGKYSHKAMIRIIVTSAPKIRSVAVPLYGFPPPPRFPRPIAAQ